MRFEQTFTVRRPPEDVFAFMVEPDNLAKWQTVKTYVTPLTDGPPRLGYRVREGTKVGPREWDQVVEFTEFEPGRAFGVRVIEGPESHGCWTFQPDGSGTRVHLEAEMKAPPGLGTLFKWIASRRFRCYHENLRRELERPNRFRGRPDSRSARTCGSRWVFAGASELVLAMVLVGRTELLVVRRRGRDALAKGSLS